MRAGLYLTGTLLAAMGVISALAGRGQYAPTAVLCLATAGVCARYATYGALSLSPDTVVIRNLLGEHVIPLTAIRAVTPDDNGLTLTTHDASSYTVFAFQKANLSRWLGRRARADTIAEEIRAAAGLTPTTTRHHQRAHRA